MNQFIDDKYHTGDNFHVTVKSQGRPQFYDGMRLLLDGKNSGDSSSKTYKHYKLHTPTKEQTARLDLQCFTHVKHNVGCLSLYWCERPEVLTFPFPMERDTLIGWCWAWLKQSAFSHQPDHDGSNGKGFMLTSGDFWGHGVDGSGWGHIVTIQSDWQMYGK